jgi:hypothetical protein
MAPEVGLEPSTARSGGAWRDLITRKLLIIGLNSSPRRS